MNFTTKLVSGILLSTFSFFAYAQNLEADAIKFGTTNNDGSARSVAVGGAMSAVGGDISSIGYNPAGIGIYNSSVILVTPSIEINKSDVRFLNSSFQNQNNKFSLSNAGVVVNIKNKKFSALQSINLGLSYQTTNSFNQKNEYRRFTNNSITNNWVAEANSINGSTDGTVDYDKFSFETVGAYYSYLVNFDSTQMGYNSPINNSVYQRSFSTIKGGSRDINLATGINLFNKFYVGGAISIPLVSYYNTTLFFEEDKKNLNGDFQDFKLSNQYKNTGSGFNAKIGFIYKPISALRVSAAIQSKTRMNLTEEYTSDFNTNFQNINYESKSSLGKFDYVLSTPWRANAGIALVHKRLGFVSFDYELVDYASTKFIFKEEFKPLADEMNAAIAGKYKIAHNFKIGAESKIKNFRIRAGYNLQTSPLKENFREGKNDFSRQQFAGGIGYVTNRVSFDATYRYSMSKEFEVSYDGVNGLNKNTDTQLFMVSVGFKLSKN